MTDMAHTGTGPTDTHRFESVPAVRDSLAKVDYLADDGLATALFLSLRLPQPLLLEGEAGVGKTEAAKSLAAALDTQRLVNASTMMIAGATQLPRNSTTRRRSLAIT